MHTTTRSHSLVRVQRRAVAHNLLLACAGTILLSTWFFGLDWFEGMRPDLVTTEASLGRLPVTIRSAGSFECQVSTDVDCGVYSLGDRSGTQILYLIPNGTHVEQGDLLVELDASGVQERLEKYELSEIRAQALQVKADAQLETQEILNTTRLAEAQQAEQLARLAWQAYQEGSAEIQHHELTSEIETTRNQIKTAELELELKDRALEETMRLREEGYRSEADVRRATLEFLRAKNELASIQNQLTNARAKLDKFNRFEDPLSQTKLKTRLRTTKLELDQTLVENEMRLVERQAQKHRRDQALASYQQRVEQYSAQVRNCKVYAPHDGIVVYEEDRRGNVTRQGDSVRWRKTILTLPNTTRMQLRVQISESEYRHLSTGLPAEVRVEAFPDRVYPGTIKSISAVPTRASRFQAVQVFEAVVTIDQKVEGVMPGMTGVVETQIQRQDPVVQVPVEAVREEDGMLCAYIDSPDGLQKRTITMGESNQEMVEISSGIEPGEAVVLNHAVLR